MIILNLFEEFILLKGLMISIVLFSYLLLNNKIQPYTQLNLNYVDSLGISLILLTINLSLLNITTINNMIISFSLIGIYVINIYYVLKMFKYLLIKKIPGNEKQRNFVHNALLKLKGRFPKYFAFIYVEPSDAYNAFRNWKKLKDSISVYGKQK